MTKKETKKGVENFTISQLREVCDQKNIDFKSSDSREDLLKKIEAESNKDKAKVEKDPKKSKGGEY